MGVARILSKLAVVSLFLTLTPTPALAQSFTFDVLFDIDRDTASGCNITINSAPGAVNGIERRLRANVDGATSQVTTVTLERCNGGVFDPPVTLDGPYPVGLNVGSNNTDVVELATSLAQLDSGDDSVIQLTFLAASDTGDDLLATLDGSPGGSGILFGLPIEVPALSIVGLAVLALVLLWFTWRHHRVSGSVFSVLLLVLAAGIVSAAHFIADGNVGDWIGIGPRATDPVGDPTNGVPGNDLQAAFLGFENGNLFFRLDVTDLENQAPIAMDDNFMVDEDTPLNIAAPGVLANDSDPNMDPITAVLATGPTNAASFTLNADGSFDYTPAADFAGTDSFTYVADDTTGQSAPATVTITVNPVNDAPIATADTATTDEDNAVVIDVLANDSDVDSTLDPASVNVTVAAGNGTTLVNTTTGEITYTKSPDFNGADSFQYEVCDQGTPLPALCATATVNITINAVNDPPTFTGGGDVTVNEDSGAYDQPWATAISPGAADETGQVLTFNVTANDNPGLFSAGPAVDSATGNLSFTPATDGNGTANITVELSDDGGTANGGSDTSAPVSFVITVNAVNDAPTFTGGGNVSVLEDSGAYNQPWASAISPGPTDESGQTVTFNITANDNPGLFSAAPAIDAAGNLSFTPAANAAGTANLMVELSDNGGTANGGVDTSTAVAFTITVQGVNDAPVFTAGANPAVDEDSGAQSLAWATAISPGPADEAGQALNFVVNQTSIDGTLSFSVAPSVNAATGNVEFTAAANAYGSATYNVSLVDNGGTANGGVDTFGPVALTITINPINDPPSLSVVPSYTAATNIRVSVNSAAGLLAGATDEATEAADPAGPAAPGTNLSLGTPLPTTTTNGGDLSINADGSFTYNPPPGFTGSDGFTYEICDDGIGAPASACSAPINITLTVSGNTVWFIDNSVSGGLNDGRLSDPFESITAFNASGNPAAGDFIFIHTGTGTYTTGVTLQDNQTLFGQGTTGTTFDVFTGITPPAGSLARPTLGGTRPLLTTAAGNAVTLALNNSLRGFNIGDTAAAGIAAAAGNGTLTVRELSISGQGTSVSLAGPGTLDAMIDNITVTAGAQGFITNTVGGTLSVTGATNISGVSGDGIAISNAPAVTDFNLGTTTISSGADGIDLSTNNAAATFRFTTPSITAPTGGGLLCDAGQIAISGTTGTIAAAGNPALNLNNTTLLGGASFANVSSTGSTTNGISLVDVTGNLTINGGALDSATGTAANIAGGADNVVYTGTINNTAGRSVRVMSHTGGMVLFSGTISDTGTGILLDNNTGASINFTNTLTLNTGINNAFTANNSGTVTVTGSASDVTTTTGTAVSISNTTIGGTGVSFRSVSSNGAANGIVLSNTGTTGAFIVTGDGTLVRNASGGTIQNTTDDGVFLMNANDVTLQQIDILNVGDTANAADITNTTNDHAVESRSGGNITLSAVTLQNPIGTAWEAFDIIGDNSIDNNSMVVGLDDTPNFNGLRVTNTDISFASVNIVNSTFDHADPTPGDAANNGNAMVVISTRGTAGGTFNVTNSSFTGARGTAITVGSGDTAGSNGTLFTNITGSTFVNAHPINGQTNIGLQTLQATTHAPLADSNTLNDVGRGASLSGQIIMQKSNTAVMDALVNANEVFNIPTQHGIDALSLSTSTGGRVDWESTGNFVYNVGRRGIFASARGNEPDMDVSLRNNQVGRDPLGTVAPVGFDPTVQRGVELDIQTAAFMQADVLNNEVISNTNGTITGGLASAVMFINSEEFPSGTAIAHVTMDSNTFTNQDGTGSPNILSRTRDGGLVKALDFNQNVANGMSSQAIVEEFTGSTVTIEDLATVSADNPGVGTFNIGAGVADHGGNVPQPDF